MEKFRGSRRWSTDELDAIRGGIGGLIRRALDYDEPQVGDWVEHPPRSGEYVQVEPSAGYVISGREAPVVHEHFSDQDFKGTFDLVEKVSAPYFRDDS
jgi:hypothetical protein